MAAVVTIIAVNFNTRRFIELCLKSIFKNTDLPYNIIVVDNGSTDGSIEYLKSLPISLICRKTAHSAAEHGRAIDQVIYSRTISTPLICTIDSDAFAAKSGWLGEINKQRGDAFAAGYEHFRDPRYLHPACMLFDKAKLSRIGNPSFMLTKKGGKLLDTGVIFSQAALNRGERLVIVKGINELVPHRWCATRVLKVSGDARLDGNLTRSEFDTESNKWFNRNDVINIMQK